jgi:hypothetical protein
MIGDVFELGGLLGKAAVIAALSFGAYLIGSFNIGSPTFFLSRLLFLRVRIWSFWSVTLPVSFERAYMDLRKRDQIKSEPTGTEMRLFLKQALLERHDLRTKLLIADKELYNEYDRLESEAEFRLNIAIPLGVLFGILATHLVWVWWLGLVPVAMVLWGGTSREFEALGVLMRAILVEKIKAGPVPISSYEGASSWFQRPST